MAKKHLKMIKVTIRGAIWNILPVALSICNISMTESANGYNN